MPFLVFLQLFLEETVPIRRPRLSRREEAEYRRCLQEMQAEGIDVDIPDPPEHVPALDISVVGGLATLIFNLPSGLAGYAICLRLVAGKSGLILPDEPRTTTKFDDQIVPESFDQRFPLCKLGQCEYPTAEVLNDRFPLKFHRPGDLIEGVILATGLEPIPKEYLQGMTVPLKLTFEDQFGNEISAEAELSVDRSTKPRKRLVGPISSLDGPEGISATSELGVGQNLNVGAVPDPDAKFPKNQVGKEEVESEQLRTGEREANSEKMALTKTDLPRINMRWGEVSANSKTHLC